MPRDYKTVKKRKKRRRKSRKNTRRPAWVWLLASLLSGVGIGLIGFYFFSGQSQQLTPTAEKKELPKKITATAKQKKTVVKEATEPRFDFYTLLPKLEMVIPEADIEAASKALPKSKHKFTYLLQVGSFRNFSDADTMKAKLALIGIKADIHSVVINDVDTWHRVRIGPYEDSQSIKMLRRELRQNNIDYMVVKIRI